MVYDHHLQDHLVRSFPATFILYYFLQVDIKRNNVRIYSHYLNYQFVVHILLILSATDIWLVHRTTCCFMGDERKTQWWEIGCRLPAFVPNRHLVN